VEPKRDADHVWHWVRPSKLIVAAATESARGPGTRSNMQLAWSAPLQGISTAALRTNAGYLAVQGHAPGEFSAYAQTMAKAVGSFDARPAFQGQPVHLPLARASNMYVKSRISRRRWIQTIRRRVFGTTTPHRLVLTSTGSNANCLDPRALQPAFFVDEGSRLIPGKAALASGVVRAQCSQLSTAAGWRRAVRLPIAGLAIRVGQAVTTVLHGGALVANGMPRSRVDALRKSRA